MKKSVRIGTVTLAEEKMFNRGIKDGTISLAEGTVISKQAG